LAPKELTRLFPDLWATKKAAERWTAKNPLKAYRDMIRVWGVITDYRRSGGHGRWSKALVRHGADARLALADVLEVPADDIRLRDRPE
jgi:broad specificity phosphatase PhoE